MRDRIGGRGPIKVRVLCRSCELRQEEDLAAALGLGRWTSAELLPNWQGVVEQKGRWLPYEHATGR